MERLTSTGFNSLRAAALIRDQDIVLLQLDMLGQARLLEHAVAELQSQAEVASSTGPVQKDVIDAAAGSLENPVSNSAGADISQLFDQLGVTQDVEEDLAPQASSSGHQPIDSDPTLYLRAP